MNYKDLKEKHEKEVNEFSKGNIIVLLGNEEEVTAKLTENNLTVEDIVNLGAGLYLKKEAIPEYNELIRKHDKEFYEYYFNNVYEVTKYELWNYETEISLSYSYNDILTKVLGLSEEEIAANKDEIDKAIADYKKEFYELN